VKLLAHLFWAAVAAAAAFCLGAIALNRGEHINSIWLVLAAACSYATGYRFYSKFLAARVLALDDRRATPAERLRDGSILMMRCGAPSMATKTAAAIAAFYNVDATALSTLADFDFFARNIAIAGGLLLLVGMGPGPIAVDNRMVAKKRK